MASRIPPGRAVSKRGFWERMEERRVAPESGMPQMKWSGFMGFQWSVVSGQKILFEEGCAFFVALDFHLFLAERGVIFGEAEDAGAAEGFHFLLEDFSEDGMVDSVGLIEVGGHGE